MKVYIVFELSQDGMEQNVKAYRKESSAQDFIDDEIAEKYNVYRYQEMELE